MKIMLDLPNGGSVTLTTEQAREWYTQLKAVFDKEVKPPYISPDDLARILRKENGWLKTTPPYTTMAYAVQPPWDFQHDTGISEKGDC